jgi:hypothetical protein
MNIDLILYFAVSVVAVLALVGAFLAVACSLFLDTLPKLPPPATRVHLDKYTATILPQADGPPKVTFRRRNSTPRRRAQGAGSVKAEGV